MAAQRPRSSGRFERLTVKAPGVAGGYLRTSATEGHARRSDPLTVGDISMHQPGTVLGKALEPLETGRGEILVLITLQ